MNSAGWQQLRLKYAASLPVRAADNMILPFVTLDDVESGTGKLRSRRVDKSRPDGVLLEPGDIAFGKLRPYLSKSLMVRERLAATSELVAIRPSSRLDQRFLLYVTLSAPWIEWANLNSYGAKMPRTSPEALANFLLTLPPLSEQRRIADFLDAETSRLDEIASIRERQLKLLRDRWATTVSHEYLALTQSYGAFRLGHYITRIEQGVSPQAESSPAELSEWGVVKVSAVKAGRFIASENKRLPGGVMPQERYEIKAGDFLITRANTPQLVGDATVVPADVRPRLQLCDKIFRLRLDRRLDPEFAAAMSQAGPIRAIREATATGASSSMVNITIDEIRSWPIPVPSMGIQREAVRRLSCIREAAAVVRERISSQIRLLAERRKSLITAAVTGQIDVTTDGGVSASAL